MGQYYNPSILKTNHKLAKNPVEIALNPSNFSIFGGDKKLTEHSWVGSGVVNAFVHLIGENSPYFGKPCVWAGDYADSYRNRLSKPEEDAMTIYDFADLLDDKLSKFKCSSSNRVDLMNAKYYKVFGKNIFSLGYCEGWGGRKIEYPSTKGNLDEYKYVINIRTHEYIEIPEPSDTDWIVHPLPILLADGNGRGGGDYHGLNMEFVGKWAFHPIGATNEIPKGYKKLEILFAER